KSIRSCQPGKAQRPDTSCKRWCKMTIKVYVPRDSAALSMDADQVAMQIVVEAARRGISVDVIRNGSRGMHWLEPLVEVATPAGRVAYGPVSPEDVSGLFDSHFLDGSQHPLRLGLTEELPWFKNQERLTFARVRL